MTKRPPKKNLPLPPSQPVEGWGGEGEEPSGGVLEQSPELAEALREAAEAVAGKGRPPAPPPEPGLECHAAGSPDAEAATARIEDLSAELVETKDRLIRLQADFENFRRRAQREREEAVRYGAQNLVKDLLTTVDNLERATDHARKGGGGDLENLLQGVELVQKELTGVMSRHGIAEVEALGKAFDPAFHEAMAQVPAPVAPNTVIEVLQKGYKLRDRLLRPARVVVARAAEQDSESGTGEPTD